MKWTGNQNCNFYEAKNFKFELVGSLPIFNALFTGVILFVTTPGIEYGAWIGGTAAWERFSSSGGISLSLIPLDFSWLHGYPSGEVHEMASSGGSPIRRLFPYAGSFVGLSLQSETPVVADTLTAKPSVGGVPIPPTGLDVTLDSTHQERSSTVAPGSLGYTFAANSLIGIILDSDILWNNGSGTIDATLFIAA